MSLILREEDEEMLWGWGQEPSYPWMAEHLGVSGESRFLHH